MATRPRKPKTTAKKPSATPEVDMFQSAGVVSVANVEDQVTRLRLITNHQNALFMLAAGMVMGPAGFGGKHYRDSLSLFPGWIPLFRFAAPAAVLEDATRESSHLRPCILLIDPCGLQGASQIVSGEGSLRSGQLRESLLGDDQVLLLPAPLPLLSTIRLAFRNTEDLRQFESLAANIGNVDLTGVMLEVQPELFDSAPEQSWPPSDAPAARNDSLPSRGPVVGGVLAMLYHSANRSATSLAAFRAAFHRASDKDRELLARDPLLRTLPDWLEPRELPEHLDVPTKLYWGVVEAIVQAKAEGSPLKPLDATLDFLKTQLEGMEDKSYRARLEKLLQDMRRSLGLGDSTVTELLERHRGSLSRCLLLLCLRETCEELLEFSHPLLSEQELVLASVLFGARDGWLAMPAAFKRPESLAFCVAQRMAEAEQQSHGGGLSFAPATARPSPLRELFEAADRGWNKKQKDAALTLARERKWAECVRTRVSLGKGEYRLLVESGGAVLLLEGEVKAVATEVSEAEFFARLASERLDPRVDASVRLALGMEN